MRFIVGERVFLDAASRASWDVVDRCRATNDEAQDPCRASRPWLCIALR
jgi:hypothetical protein